MEEERDTKLEVETGWPTRERRFNRVSDAPLAPDFFIFDLFFGLFVLKEKTTTTIPARKTQTRIVWTTKINIIEKEIEKRSQKEREKS